MMTDISYVFLEKLIATAKENYPRMNSFEGRIKAAKTMLGKSNYPGSMLLHSPTFTIQKTL
jgi:hypothetical protein